VAATAPDETAAILFTSGSTGPAKGVVYTHRIFDAQVRLLHEAYGIGPGDCDLPCFPLFGLFSTALGATAVIPHMDFTRPAKVAPRAIVEPIRRFHVTYSFGSPALWETVGAWCARRGERLPGLRRIFMSGAPAPAALHRLLLEQVLDPGAETHTPYGATESLPVADITGHEVLAETAARTAQGAGTCVGRPVPGIEVRILPITDGPLPAYPEGAELPPGEIGEIAVRGEVVTPAYYGLEEATALAKMRDAQGRLWHRIGDVGHLDAQGRLWFCGRKAHRVRTPHGPLFTITCEAIFRNHPDVHRAALVGVGDAAAAAQVPVMVIEPNPGRFPCTARRRAEFARQLLGLGAASPVTAGIRQIFFRKAFPVDIRHNAKIRREELALWAAARLGRHRGG
jgi:acyl-CoA synthetase (AMP-forming)/AMP-acid ligase II